MSLTQGLLEDVKNHLDITWTDVSTDQKMSGIIARGIKYIDQIAGVAQDYTVDDKPKELLLEYCRYARSNALDSFRKNYLSELMSFQLDVKATQALAFESEGE